uniref:glycine rich domain-containing protein n=1 Tax=Odoribacter lunatus TaxID=2941335 RepID=UPI00203D28E1
DGTFPYRGYMDSVTLAAGKYQMICWGAQGGSYNKIGGYGGRTSGDINLPTQRVLYIYVGEQGYKNNTTSYAFNGGGMCGGNYNARGGGGASDIRLSGGSWNNFNSLKSRIMVAGGGGGSDNHSGGSNGGDAGGLTGSDGNKKASRTGTSLYVAKGGTQTAGGVGGHRANGEGGGSGGFGTGGNKNGSHGGGGGSGYYGGGSGHWNAAVVGSGAGGSSFISGHSGCNAISASSTSTSIIHTGQAKHYSGLFFTNTSMTSGSNSGNGQVRITPLN